MKRITLQIEGMSCGHCVHAVTEALSTVPGVRVDKVDLGRATVDVDDPAMVVSKLIDAIDDAGYAATEAVA
jgi:copper chaperone